MNQWQLRTFERIQVARYRIKDNVMLHFYTLLLRFERCTSSKRGKGRKSRCIDLWSVIWNSAAVSYVAQVYSAHTAAVSTILRLHLFVSALDHRRLHNSSNACTRNGLKCSLMATAPGAFLCIPKIVNNHRQSTLFCTHTHTSLICPISSTRIFVGLNEPRFINIFHLFLLWKSFLL